MKNSLSTTLLINTATVLLAISVLVFTVYAVAMQSGGINYLLEQDLKRGGERVSDALRFNLEGEPVQVELPAEMRMIYSGLPHDMIYRVIDSDGRVLLASDAAAQPFKPDAGPFSPYPAQFRVTSSDVLLHVLTVPLAQPGRPFYVQVARSERLQQALQDKSGRTSTAVALCAGVVAMLTFSGVVWLTFRRALQPLRDASDAATRISPENLRDRLATANMPSEVLPLVEAFNAALARVEQGYRVQQEFLATAAHELKTPLTLMRGQLELAGLADPAQLLRDVDGMSRQVQQLLNLAECSEQQNYVFGMVDARAAVEQATGHLQRMATQRGVGFDISVEAAPVLFRADRGALFVLLKNLLENAIHHSAAGRPVRVGIAAGHISVRNEGGRIPPEHLPLLFQRFWRGPHRRDDGAGLGLAICREIALAHQWRLDASDDGHDVEFRLVFG